MWWHNITNGLPVPLGINVASNKSLTLRQIREFDTLFKKSIIYGLNNMEETINYAMKYGRGQAQNMISKFVNMYVNDLTIDMGDKGKQAIEKVFDLTIEKHIYRHSLCILHEAKCSFRYHKIETDHNLNITE